MLRRRTVAWLIAGLLAGTQAGIASIDNQADESAEAVSTAGPEITVAGAAPEASVSEPVTEAVSETTVSAAPFSEMRSSTLPSSADDVELLPSLAAYLERKAATQLTGAPGNVFPSSADDIELLPSLVAYLEQREATRLATEGTAGSVPAAADRHAMLFSRDANLSR